MNIQIRGWDYALELCLFLDLLRPVTDLMLNAQLVNQQVWEIVTWSNCVKTKLEAMLGHLDTILTIEDLSSLPADLFICTSKHAEELASNTFQEQPLLEGWLINTRKCRGKKTNSETNGTNYEWEEKEFCEVIDEIKNFTSNLLDQLRDRLVL